MPIRLSGLNSGLDTDSIISELVKAKSTKKETLIKDQKKLSWKQDIWKTLNTKIYSLYSKTLDSMRLAGSYSKKSASVSNSNAVSVIVGDNGVNSVQSLKIKQLAQTGYLTGAKLSDTATYKSDAKLTDTAENGGMGLAVGGSFTVTTGGVATEITIDDTTTITDVVWKLQKAGLNANFDEKNQRLFVSAKETGKDNDFTLTASNAGGDATLVALGLKTNILTDTNANAFLTTLNGLKGADDATTIANLKNSSIVKTTAQSQAVQYQSSVKSLEKGITANTEKIDKLNIDKEDQVLTEDDRAAIQKEIDELTAENTRLSEQKGTEESYFSVDSDGKVTATDALVTKVSNDLLAKVNYAETALASTTSTSATRIVGQDSAIILNNAEFASSTNTYEINGLTITAKQETGDNAITITTADDTDGIYDMIKNFLKEYNTLINEMDKLYNADSSKKYPMLSDEEKESMSDDDVKEWETKIKDSLLRKDSTLSTVAGAMKQIMLEGVKMSDGKTLYLSEFGVNTMNYFNAAEDEKNAYHIDGDPDDSSTSNQADKLKSMIASDPDKVTEFFSSLSRNLYSKLNELMASTDYSSAYTVYNDKQMKKEYSDYTSKISAQEELINDYEDRYYKKFTAMETAMSKMNSQQSALTKLFGG